MQVARGKLVSRRALPATAFRALVLFVLVTACGGNDDRPAGAAQLSRMTNRNPEWGNQARWRVDSQPVLTIPSTQQGEALAGILAAEETPDGRIMVADTLGNAVRVFTPDGSVSAVFPPAPITDETLQLRSAAVYSADTIVVVDSVRRRILQFPLSEPEGIRAITFDAFFNPAVLTPSASSRVTPLSGGGFILQRTSESSAGVTSAGSAAVAPQEVTWVGRGLSRADVLGIFPGDERTQLDVNGRSFNVPAAHRSRLITSGDPQAQRICIGHSSERRVYCFEFQLRGVEFSWPEPNGAEVTAAGIAEDLGARGFSSADAAAIGESLAARAQQPQFRNMYVASDLGVWIEIEPVAAAVREGRWRRVLVFQRDGSWLGVVDVPPIEIHQIFRDHILGVATDAAGRQRVVVHLLRKDTGGQPRNF